MKLTIIFLLLSQICFGQTIFRFEASGGLGGQSTGVLSTWATTGSQLSAKCHATGYKQSTTISSTSHAVPNTTSTLFGQFVSPALNAQTISGTVTGYARMQLNNVSGATCQSRVKITVINREGTVVATLLALTSGASNLTTTLTSYQILNAAALTSYACANGDRICIEIGIGRSAGTTSRTGTVSFGSSSATDITAAGSTTANNPVITFSGNISFYQGG